MPPGMAVRTAEGQMGNSEVGHLNMGAGRIVYQELTRITKEIQDGDFFKNEALLAAVKKCKRAQQRSALYGSGIGRRCAQPQYSHLWPAGAAPKKRPWSVCALFPGWTGYAAASGKGYVEELTAKMAELGVQEKSE